MVEGCSKVQVWFFIGRNDPKVSPVQWWDNNPVSITVKLFFLVGHSTVCKAFAWEVVSSLSLEGFKFTEACWDSGDSGPPETYMDPDGCFPSVYQNYVGALKIFSVCGGLLRPAKSASGAHTAGLPNIPGRTFTTLAGTLPCLFITGSPVPAT